MDAAVTMTKQGVRNLNNLGPKRSRPKVEAEQTTAGVGAATDAAPDSTPATSPAVPSPEPSATTPITE